MEKLQRFEHDPVGAAQAVRRQLQTIDECAQLQIANPRTWAAPPPISTGSGECKTLVAPGAHDHDAEQDELSIAAAVNVVFR